MTEIEKRLKHIEKTNAKRAEIRKKYEQSAEKKMNKYNQREQNNKVKKATVVKSKEDRKTNVNFPENHNIVSGDLNQIENNYLNNYISQRNYNDENVRVFTKERNQRKADALKSNINKIMRRQSNQNRLNELEVEEANLKKRDGRNNVVEPLAEDYDKIEKIKKRQQEIDDERKAIKSGYNAPINVSDDNLYSAWFVHNYKENLEKNAEKSLHDENIKLNNQQSKIRNASYDTLMQDRREQISQAQKAKAEELQKDLETQGFDTYQEMVDYNKSWKGTLSYIGRSALNSLAHFNKNITTDVRDFLGIREELNDLGLGFLNDIADYYGDVADNDDKYLSSKSKYVGKGTQIAGEGAKIVAQMAPQIAFALMSGGSSTAISAGETLENATTSAKVLSSLKTMAKQPTFWTSVIQEGGNAYEEAKQNGASQENAQLSAIYTGLINATIEMGGGIEDGAQKGLKKLIKVGNEEGLEEVKQDLVSGLTSKSIYDKDKPLFSTEDDNAVINPSNEIKSYLGGFFGGTVGAGMQQGAVAVANKISDKKLSKAKDIYNQYQEQLLAEKQNENKTDNTMTPTVEAVFSEAETNQKKAKRLTQTINKIDRGETVADSEIVELKYNNTAAEMLGQMAGLKENKINSNYDNEAVRAVINQAQNGKKNIDTATILNNIRSNTQSNQNLVENSNEDGSDEVLNADEGNLANTNQTALENATEPNMASQLDEVSEAMPENITADEEADVLDSDTYIDNVSDNFKYNKVVNNSNKIMKLGISTEKTGSTNIRKVKSVDNGVAQLLMTNGEVVPADTIDFSDNKNAEIILSNAGKYNSNTASTFIANYDSNTSTAENYSIAFNSVYRMAEKGLSINEIASQTRGARTILGENTFNAAINAGRNTANGTFADDTTNVASSVRTTDVSKQRVLQNKNENNNVKGEVSRINVRQAAKSLSTALGVKINVYNSDTSVRGYEQNGEVFINESYVNNKANSASEFNFILAHELTHTLEQSNYYDQLKTFILNSRVYDDYLTSNDTTHKAEISKRQELYEKYGKELTKEEAERELIADFIADELLTNEECIRELAYKDKKLFAKVIGFIHKMIDNLKRFVRNSKEITAAQKDLIHIKELYTKAFNDVKKNGTYSNEVKYSKKLGGYNPDIRVTTDNVLKEYGIKNIRNVTDIINKVSLKLRNSYLSTDKIHKPITNIDTGLKIEIRKSGIRETFGKAEYYKYISDDLKLAKIASMSELAKMIKYGEVRAKDAPNYHNPRSEANFSYLKSSINIDGVNYGVTMDIKRLPGNENIFYIHDLKIKKQETNSVRQISSNALKVNLPLAKNNISHNDDIVNSNIRKNSENDTRKFSINPKFEAQYDKWDKKNQYKVFILGKTSNALKSVGLSDKTITMDSSKILKIKKKHSAMTDEIIKDVPKVLENPIAIMKSKTRNNRITMFGSLTDIDGKPVLAVLELNPIKYGYKLDEYKVASAYGKDNLQNLIDTSEILYIDNKKRTTDLLNETRLQLPSTFNKGSSYDSIISKDDIDVNNNILKNSENDTRKFSIDPEFESKYDNWDKKKSTFSFKIGTTSEALKSIGVKDSSVFWDASKIIKIQRDHPQMTDDVIKQVPNVLEDPILIMKSITVDGRLTLFGEVYDAANNPVLAVLELNPTNAKGKSLNIIKIASAYGKDTNPQRLIDNSQIVYIEPNKKRTNDWLKLNRLQLPLVNQSGSNNSISQKNNTVNSNIRKNSENDTRKFSIDPDVESQMKALNEQYGTKKKGENPVRDIDVPERSSKDKRVREFVKTILESGALTDEMVNEVDKQIVKGAASYLPLSNENTLRVAKEWLDNKGKGVTEKQWNDWRVMSNRNHKVSALDVAKGELLLRYAAQNNDTKKVIQLTGELAEMATTAGQTVQAMRLLKKSSGIGKLYYVEQTVRRMNADYQAKYANKLAKGKDIPQITIDEDLALKLAQAKTQTEIEEAEAAITKNIGEQVPATWIDKWNAWRYMSMLFNPTTHIRNIVGNTIFMPAVSMKNGIAYGLEKAFLKGDIEKSKALKVKDAYKEFAKQDFDYVKAELTGNGKYESTDMIQSNKIIFKNKLLEGLRNFNTNLLEAEDGIFLKHHYERALGMYLQSNNISLNELSDTKAENERQAAIDRGRVRAIKEAQKATYRDASKIADTISRIAKTNLATEVIVEGVIPFKKTPVNIAKRAAEYSPLGLIETLSRESVKLKKGDITASEFIDRISAGLTGSAIYALGLCLGSLGLLKVGLGDDDKERDFEKLKGHQEFSVEILGYSYTFDWACPAAIPLFVGAKTHEILEKDNRGLTGADYQDLVGTMFDPMFEMSVLSGIDNLINNVKYSESPVIDTGLYSATSYLGQAVPTIGGKIASTIDETRRSSYIDKSKDTLVSKLLTSSQQQFVNKIIKKIPGATYLLSPYINEWGKQEKEKNIGMRLFKNFISPGYVSKIEVDEVEKMLDDTYKDSGDSAVLPTKSKKHFSVGGETVNLTAEEYETYATVRGQMAHSILKDLSNNSDFETADSTDKADLISQSYDLSNAIAKQGVSDYIPDGWIAKAINANKKGMKYSDFLVLHNKLKGISGQGTKEKIYRQIKYMDLNKDAKEALWLSFYDDMKLEGERIYF